MQLSLEAVYKISLRVPADTAKDSRPWYSLFENMIGHRRRCAIHRHLFTNEQKKNSSPSPAGFEPTRTTSNRFRVCLLNHSDKTTVPIVGINVLYIDEASGRGQQSNIKSRMYRLLNTVYQK